MGNTEKEQMLSVEFKLPWVNISISRDKLNILSSSYFLIFKNSVHINLILILSIQGNGFHAHPNNNCWD